jgi:DNA-binding LytR/AlgR family response regulator
MTQLRCLALDVDKPALAEVTFLLDTDHRVATVQSTGNIHDAVDIVRRESIDAVFVCLVHHTIEQAFSIVASAQTRPKFIALARDSTQAVPAFEMGAIDYIIKPLTRDHVNRAIDRLLDVRTPLRPADRLTAEQGGATHFIDRRDILWVQACGDYTTIVTHNGEFTCRMSMTSVSERLLPHGFFRVHRAWLVPLNRIEAFSQLGSCATITIAGEQIPVARRNLRDLKVQLT